MLLHSSPSIQIIRPLPCETDRWQQLSTSLAECIESVWPWLCSDDAPSTPTQHVANLAQQRPNVWLAITTRPTNETPYHVLGGASLTHIIPNNSAVLHGMTHQCTHRPSRPHRQWKAALSLAVLEAAFSQYQIKTVFAHVPQSHAGARGFCWAHGFKKCHSYPHAQQHQGHWISADIYQLDAATYTRTVRPALIQRAIPPTATLPP